MPPLTHCSLTWLQFPRLLSFPLCLIFGLRNACSPLLCSLPYPVWTTRTRPSIPSPAWIHITHVFQYSTICFLTPAWPLSNARENCIAMLTGTILNLCFLTFGHSGLWALITAWLAQFPVPLPGCSKPPWDSLSPTLYLWLFLWAGNFLPPHLQTGYNISYLDCWNHFLTGLPVTCILPHQYIFYTAIRVTFLKLTSDYVIFLLRSSRFSVMVFFVGYNKFLRIEY